MRGELDVLLVDMVKRVRDVVLGEEVSVRVTGILTDVDVVVEVMGVVVLWLT